MRELPDHVFAVILAGGSGTRFWPKSRQKFPKQLCAIGSKDESMLELTLKRLDGFVPPERRMIVTHIDQVEETRKIAGSKCPLILAEPEARNTANALAMAALEISKRGLGSKAIMVSLHADHVIEDVTAFKKSLQTAIDVASTGDLCLIGIVPKYPETGYGYIERGPARPERGSYRVNSFREKPERLVAEEFCASGRFYWNAGLFVFPVDVLISELVKRLSSTISMLEEVLIGHRSFMHVPAARLAATYAKLPKISIDHAVLEVSDRVSVVEADIGWQDVGSWDALSQCFDTDAKGNYLQGDIVMIDSEGCVVETDGPVTACLGLKDLVVVHAKGAILVCPKNRSQDVKKIVDYLKENGRMNLI